MTSDEMLTDHEKAIGDGELSDPTIVNWDGDKDPTNPHNWSAGKKVLATLTVSIMTLVTPLGSSMFAPTVAQVMAEFNSNDPELAGFVVSVYLLGYALGPLLLAPLSELYGRKILYNVCNALYAAFTVACAVAPSLGALVSFRFFAGAVGSAPLTIGAGSLADFIGQEHRGAAMGAWVLGPVLGPVIGPVAGGYLGQAKGWRWTFWVLAMAAGAVAIFAFLFMPESFAPTLLRRKTERLRKETGNQSLKSALDNDDRSPKRLFATSILRPTKMLFLSPIIFMLSLYVAVIYGYLYLLFTTMTDVFHNTYGFSQGSVGLSFLGIGVGSIAGMVFQSLVSDRIFKYCSVKSGVVKLEYRLIPLILIVWSIPISLFWYGWTADAKLHWMWPIVGTSLLGFGMLCVFTTVSTFLVDVYTVHAASAMAANTVLRSLGGAFLPLVGARMYDTLGLGWGHSLLAFVALAMCPLPIFFYHYGERIRSSKRFRIHF